MYNFAQKHFALMVYKFPYISKMFLTVIWPWCYFYRLCTQFCLLEQ